MDNIEFGKFISQLRNEKKLTQKGLAEKLHVTDKAISKWECGLGFPDIKMLKPLSSELGINVLELMNCKRNQELAISTETANQIISETLNQSEISAKKRNMLFKARALISAACICLLYLIYLGASAVYVTYKASTVAGIADGNTAIYVSQAIKHYDSPLFAASLIATVMFICLIYALRFIKRSK